MAWQIKTTGGAFSSLTDFDAAKIVKATRSLGTMGQDSATVEFRRDFDASRLFTEEEVVEVWNGATLFFKGPVVTQPISAAGPRERHVIHLRSPWWFLENCTYLQYYAAVGDTTAGEEEGDPTTVAIAWRAKSRVMLCTKDPDTELEEDPAGGDLITTGASITAILDFAIAQGCPISYGSILTGMTVPVTEMVDATCAECILSLLGSWHPDAIVYHDWSDGGKICIQTRASLSSVTVPLSSTGTKCTDFTVHPRPDLIPSGVAVHYEVTSTIDNRPFLNISTDEDGDASGRRGLHFTVPIEGTSITTLKQKVVTDNIPDTGDSDAAAWTWIGKHFPELKGEDKDDFIIGSGSFEQSIPDDVDVESFSRELVEGALPEWMEGSADYTTAPISVTCYLSYKGTGEALKKLFAPTGKRVFRCQITGTKMRTKTYSKVTGFNVGESPPTGLAAAYYAALNHLLDEGSLTLHDTECDLAIYPGKKLTLTNGPTVTNPVLVQQVEQDSQGGTTAVAFGPFNAGLAPADWIERQRGLIRTTKLSYEKRQSRNTPEGSAKGAEIPGSQQHPRNAQQNPPPPDPPLLFEARRVGSASIQIAAGMVYATDWGTVTASDPTVAMCYKAFTTSAATITGVAVGTKIYAKLDISQGSYSPKGALGDKSYTTLSWTGTWAGSVAGTCDCVCSGSGSGSGGAHECTCTWTGTVAGSVSGQVVPGSIGVPTTFEMEVRYWQLVTVFVAKYESPVNSDTAAYILLAEAIEDTDTGDWEIQQHHAGAIFFTSPVAVTAATAGGDGP